MQVKFFQNKEKSELKIVVSFDKEVKARKFFLVRKSDEKSIAQIDKPNLYQGSEIYSYFDLPENFSPNEYHLELLVDGEFIKLELERF